MGLECGVEQEFQVLGEHGQADFRVLLPGLTAGLGARDPGDPRAHRLPNGTALTADGWEAELVTAPTATTPSGFASVAADLRQAETELAGQLPGMRLVGFSTHLNVSVPDDIAVHIAEQVARQCLAAIDAVVRPAKPTGWLVRPRRSRLEVGTDFLNPAQTLLGLAALAGCVHALAQGDAPPPGPASTLVPSREKFGFFCTPEGLGPPPKETLRWIGDHVLSLGLPSIVGDSLPSYQALAKAAVAKPVPGPDVAPRQRGRTAWSCVWLTWRLVAWMAHDECSGRRAFAVLPVAAEPQFLSLLDSGVLDGLLARAMRSPLRRVLLTHAQTNRAALWSDLRPGALVPAERTSEGKVPRVTRRAARGDWRRHRHAERREIQRERGA